MTPAFTEKQALDWARRNRARIIVNARTETALSTYMEGFFDESSAWVKMQRGKGRVMSDRYLAIRRGHVDNYLGPLFGAIDARNLTASSIEKAIYEAQGRHGKPLAPATKYKIVDTLRIILDDLYIHGKIERNPIENLLPYSKRPVAPRGAIPRDAFPLLFPATHGELVRVWGGSMWAAMMCLFRDTGLRDGEARALRWRELYLDDRIVPIRNAVASGTASTIKATKTEQVKAGILSLRTVQELTIWKAESAYTSHDDFIFTLDGEKPVTNAGVLKAFRRGLKKAGYGDMAWTPYWLRHSFITYSMEGLEDSEILMLAGHTILITNAIYRHPDDEVIIARAKPTVSKMDKIRDDKY